MVRVMMELLKSGDLSAQRKCFKIMELEAGLIFYHAGIETGLFELLSCPATFEEIMDKLFLKNRQLLSSLLDMGCSLKELKLSRGKYSLKGAMAKALVHNVPVRELVRETVGYHADLAKNLQTILFENLKHRYLEEFGGVIAESSRLTEPLIKAFIYKTVKKTRPLSILEIGCGSGEYLRYYVDINSRNTGMALDIDASAVQIAQKRIRENGIGENFTAVEDNIVRPEKIKGRKFDLVTSYSNIYYFSAEERLDLFRSIHGMLNENGMLMLATGVKSKSLSSSYYDLIFTATAGLYPLPDTPGLVRDIKKCGFERVRVVRIMGSSFAGIVAYR